LAQVLKKGAASLEKRQDEAKNEKAQVEKELREAREADDRAYREKIEFSKLTKFERTVAYVTMGISYLIYKAVAGYLQLLSYKRFGLNKIDIGEAL